MLHSVKWHEDALNAVAEERATVADLRIFIDNMNVTEHILESDASDHVTVALYGLVDGLVHDWWSIFGARDREFSLRNYRTGYLIPDVRILFDGATFEVAAHQSVYTDPPLRFWGGNTEALSREEGETWLSGLVQEVLDRLDEKGVKETSVALRWRRIKSSKVSGESKFCETAGSLGLDPYEISEDVAGFIETAEAIFAQEALVEFASGARGVDHFRLIDWVGRMSRMKGLKYRLANLRDIVDKIAKLVPLRPGEPAWAAGYRRARALRRELDLKQNDRFMSFMKLARKLGAPKNYNLAPKVNGISALRRDALDHINVHLRNYGDFDGSTATHLFALARAIGDSACFPEPQTSPINNVRHAYRQAAGRAFAAEFLAPIEEIRSMQEDERDIHSIADDFGVATMVIEHQIENQERITQACA